MVNVKFSSKDWVEYIKLKDPSQYTEEDAMYVFCNQNLSDYPSSFIMYMNECLDVKEKQYEEGGLTYTTTVVGFKKKVVHELGYFHFLEKLKEVLRVILKTRARELASEASGASGEDDVILITQRGYVFLKHVDYIIFKNFYNSDNHSKFQPFRESMINSFKEEFKAVGGKVLESRVDDYFDSWEIKEGVAFRYGH